MARSWLVDGRGIASKVKNATLPFADQIKDCGANRECPKCHHRIDNSDVSHAWPGLPAGVKFDPSDAEILDHLAAKCRVANCVPHMLIDEFIPTLDGKNGICYTHPKNLPGAKEDGNSVYFFHRTVNAYTTGQRKRRKIQAEDSLTKEHVRWHKTGKTSPVMENGTQKGCKKFMVLYRSSVKGFKPGKSNWVMHQYHLGTEEDEKDGQYVVSKIFYQWHKQADKNNDVAIIERDKGIMHTSPKTPKTNTPNPPRSRKSDACDDVIDDYILKSPIQEAEFVKDISVPSSSQAHFKDEIECPYLVGESQAVDLDSTEDLLLCNEILDSYVPLDNSGLYHGPSPACVCDISNTLGAERSESCGIAELENIELDTPPDFQLSVPNVDIGVPNLRSPGGIGPSTMNQSNFASFPSSSESYKPSRQETM